MTPTLKVSVFDGCETYAYQTQIEPRLMRIFEPMHVCDDSVLGPLIGAVTSEQARLITVRREDYAKLMADGIAKGIMAYIERNDTVNGYKVKEPS